MGIEKDFEKTLEFDPEKVEKILDETVEVYQKYKPTAGEIIIALSNLIYSLGASIGEYNEKGPSLDELKKLYYEQPQRLDVAMMLQGLTLSTWYEAWEKLSLESQEDKEGEKS